MINSLFGIVINMYCNLLTFRIIENIQEEVNIRLKITEVQNTYQKKQDRLHRLKTPKKRPAKGAKGEILAFNPLQRFCFKK